MGDKKAPLWFTIPFILFLIALMFGLMAFTLLVLIKAILWAI